MKVCKIFTFDSAHYLPNHTGKCRNLHGHTYRVEVELQGEPNPETGMLVDFGEIKEIVAPIIEMFDHHYINDILPLPTAENMCQYILAMLRDKVPHVSRIRVWETPTSYAEVEI